MDARHEPAKSVTCRKKCEERTRAAGHHALCGPNATHRGIVVQVAQVLGGPKVQPERVLQQRHCKSTHNLTARMRAAAAPISRARTVRLVDALARVAGVLGVHGTARIQRVTQRQVRRRCHLRPQRGQSCGRDAEDAGRLNTPAQRL